MSFEGYSMVYVTVLSVVLQFTLQNTHNFLAGFGEAIDAIHGARIRDHAIVHDTPLVCFRRTPRATRQQHGTRLRSTCDVQYY